MIYQFPRSIFVDKNGISNQVSHIHSESCEALQEISNFEIIMLAMEIMDTYHSAETALRILEERHGVDIEKLRELVIQKNSVREYYACQ